MLTIEGRWDPILNQAVIHRRDECCSCLCVLWCFQKTRCSAKKFVFNHAASLWVVARILPILQVWRLRLGAVW